MEVKPVPHRVQPIFYRPSNYKFCSISFDGIKWYSFKVENVHPGGWIKKFDYIIEHTEATQIRCDGFYDRDNKVVGFFDNRKIYKLYDQIIASQKLERLNRTYLPSDTERREKRMGKIREWKEEYGQTFLNAQNVKRGDIFNISEINVVERDDWDKPRIQFTMSPVKSDLKEEEVFAGMGKRNLDALIEGFGTDDDDEWLGKNIEVAAIMAYNIGGSQTKGIVWAVPEE